MPTWGQLLSTAKEAIVSTTIPSGEIDDIAYSAYTELVDYYNRARSSVFLRWNSAVQGQLPTIIPISNLSATPQISNSSQSLTDVLFLGQRGWATGNGGDFLRTTDGGMTWGVTSGILGAGVPINAGSLFDMNNGVVVGVGGGIATSNDGGVTGTPRVSGTTEDLNGVAYLSNSIIFAVGNGGVILRSIDGGATWGAQTSSTTNALFDVAAGSSLVGYAVGATGRIVKTTDAGATAWTVQTSGTLQNLNGVFFIDANTGWAVGDAGTIIATTNGGSTWTPQMSNTTQNLNSVYFVDALKGWAVGNGGVILATTNGGSTWTPQISGVTTNLNAVHFVSPSRGYVVGDNGLILELDITTIQRYLLPTDADLKNGNPVVTIRTNTGQSFESVTYDDMVVESAVSGAERKNLFTVENNVLFLLVNDSVTGFFYNYLYVLPRPTAEAMNMNFSDSLIPFWKLLFLKQFYQSRNIPLTARLQRQLNGYIAGVS